MRSIYNANDPTDVAVTEVSVLEYDSPSGVAEGVFVQLWDDKEILLTPDDAIRLAEVLSDTADECDDD